uniref:Olfactory receptor family 1 subfamily J member 2 n=1 Tax=Saimiri boliviensis boliviensis TaxID=39432 RepID=A0A2K6S3S5_SAIBB
MSPENLSCVSEFLLLGLPIRPEQQAVFFDLFLGMYLTMVLGNLLIILLIRLDSHLHTRMYFFLSHLALTDIFFSSVTVPKMLTDMQSTNLSPMRSAFLRCIFLYFLLTWTASLLHQWRMTYMLPYWLYLGFHLVLLSCSDIFLNELVMFTVGVVVITLPFMCILVSYGYIGATILRVPSTKGIRKALSMCGSHLSVVSLYYGSIFGQYLFPTVSSSIDKDVIVALMYTVVTPMLNPFIYSLRNRDMKEALGKLFSRAKFFSS